MSGNSLSSPGNILVSLDQEIKRCVEEEQVFLKQLWVYTLRHPSVQTLPIEWRTSIIANSIFLTCPGCCVVRSLRQPHSLERHKPHCIVAKLFKTCT